VGLVLAVSPVAPSLRTPRAWPCQSKTTLGHVCGADPALRYLRVCTHKHQREVWLCDVHSRLISLGGGICDQCATDRTHPHRCMIGIALLL
jgi:hypothetical protein